MPIKGLTDRAPQFPKIGDIRKGAPKTSNRPGKDLTYFRAVFPEDEANAAAAFLDAYGAEPREINILLPFPDTDRNFEAWQEEYTASALIHRCDGETCVIWRDADGQMHHTPKPCPSGCKPTGRLKVIIPELRRLAYVEVHTTSVWDIAEITANLDSLAKLTRNGVSGIPLVLKRRPREISTPRQGGKRARQTKWLLSIEAEPKWVDAKLTAMKLEALPGRIGPLALPASSELTVDAEFEDEETEEWDGEVFDAAQAAGESAADTADLTEPEPVPAKSMHGRPYPPAKVRAGLEARISRAKRAQRTGRASPAQTGLLAGKLEECFAGAGDANLKRHSVTGWLIGKTSTNEITLAEASAMIDWLLDKDADEGTFDLHPAAPAEAAAILREAQLETGQQEIQF